MSYRNVSSPIAKSRPFFILTVVGLSLFISCGSETEETQCEGVKKAECPLDDQVEEVESCEEDTFTSCSTVTEGEGECKTTVTCAFTIPGCNNTYVACPEGYEISFCKVGEGTCILSESGVCTEPGTCEKK